MKITRAFKSEGLVSGFCLKGSEVFNCPFIESLDELNEETDRILRVIETEQAAVAVYMPCRNA